VEYKMMKNLELTYVGYELSKYNPTYVIEEFKDIEGNKYIWLATANTKAWNDDFIREYKKGDKVKIRASVEKVADKYEISRVKIIK
jgi:hypothetical protein